MTTRVMGAGTQKWSNIITTTSTTPKSQPKKSVAADKPSLSIEELVAHIKSFAHQNREEGGGGWDVIEDTWSDEQIEAQIKGAKTKLGAQSKMAKPVLALRAEKRAAREAAKAQTEAAKLAKAEAEDRTETEVTR